MGSHVLLFVTPIYWISAGLVSKHALPHAWRPGSRNGTNQEDGRSLCHLRCFITWSTARCSSRRPERYPYRSSAPSFSNTNRTRLGPDRGHRRLCTACQRHRSRVPTDLIQGFCIILLSVLLIPFGLHAVGKIWFSGRFMDRWIPRHARTIARRQFHDFGWRRSRISLRNRGHRDHEHNRHRTYSHFIVTGGGTAKSEQDARIGLVTGNFIKRFCTIGWVITALIVLTLFGDDMALIKDADMAWGTATKELLGPLGQCQSASGLPVGGSYEQRGLLHARLLGLGGWKHLRPFRQPQGRRKGMSLPGRATGGVVVLGAVIISVTMLICSNNLN